jgi:hypothetical protein
MSLYLYVKGKHQRRGSLRPSWAVASQKKKGYLLITIYRSRVYLSIFAFAHIPKVNYRKLSFFSSLHTGYLPLSTALRNPLNLQIPNLKQNIPFLSFTAQQDKLRLFKKLS